MYESTFAGFICLDKKIKEVDLKKLYVFYLYKICLL